jgi:hypothetical protein
MHHVLKTDPLVFQSSLDGVKGFELRLNDRDFSAGDTIITRYARRVATNNGWKWQIPNINRDWEWDWPITTDQEILNEIGMNMGEIKIIESKG